MKPPGVWDSGIVAKGKAEAWCQPLPKPLPAALLGTGRKLRQPLHSITPEDFSCSSGTVRKRLRKQRKQKQVKEF